MADEEITVAEIEAERSLMRIFGSYQAYSKSLPASLWTRSANGLWVGRSR